MKYGTIIGVDPDSEASGVAVVDVQTRHVTAHTLAFPECMEYLRHTAAKADHQPVLVVVEAGWLNAGNWHLGRYASPQKCSAMGVSVGRNQETGRKILEMLRYYGIPCEARKPLVKCWKGKDRKITHEEIREVTGISAGRTNQEERDAILLAWVAAELPVTIGVKKAGRK